MEGEALVRGPGRRGALPRRLPPYPSGQALMMGDVWQALTNLRQAEARLRKLVAADSEVLRAVVEGQDVLRTVLPELTVALLREVADVDAG